MRVLFCYVGILRTLEFTWQSFVSEILLPNLHDGVHLDVSVHIPLGARQGRREYELPPDGPRENHTRTNLTVTPESARATLAPFLKVVRELNEYAGEAERLSTHAKEMGRISVTNIDLYEEKPYPEEEQRMCNAQPDPYLTPARCQLAFNEVGYRFHYQQNSWRRCWDLAGERIKEAWSQVRAQKNAENIFDSPAAPSSSEGPAAVQEATSSYFLGEDARVQAKNRTAGVKRGGGGVGSGTGAPVASYSAFFDQFYQFIMKVRPDTFFFPRTRVLREEKVQPRLLLSSSPSEADRRMWLEGAGRDGSVANKMVDVLAVDGERTADEAAEASVVEGKNRNTIKDVGSLHGFQAMAQSTAEVEYMNTPDKWLLWRVLDVFREWKKQTAEQAESGPRTSSATTTHLLADFVRSRVAPFFFDATPASGSASDLRSRFLFFRDLLDVPGNYFSLLEDTLLKHGGDAVFLFRWNPSAQPIFRGMVGNFLRWWRTYLSSKATLQSLSHHCRLGFLMQHQRPDLHGDMAFGVDIMPTDASPEPVDLKKQALATDAQLQQELLNCHHSHLGAIVPPWYRQYVYEKDVIYP
eukprot:g14355.t1